MHSSRNTSTGFRPGGGSNLLSVSRALPSAFVANVSASAFALGFGHADHLLEELLLEELGGPLAPAGHGLLESDGAKQRHTTSAAEHNVGGETGSCWSGVAGSLVGLKGPGLSRLLCAASGRLLRGARLSGGHRPGSICPGGQPARRSSSVHRREIDLPLQRSLPPLVYVHPFTRDGSSVPSGVTPDTPWMVLTWIFARRKDQPKKSKPQNGKKLTGIAGVLSNVG